MKLLVALAIGTAVVALPVVAKPANTSAAKSEDARFTAFGEQVVDAYLKLDPVGATQAGDHRYDALMPDASAAGRAARDALAQRSLAELAKFDRSKLSREHQVDAILLKDQLDYLLFSNDRLQDWAWDPLTYNGTVGGALFPLSTRNFAPLPMRLRSATARLNALPTYLQQARQSLVPARVPRIHAETVSKQNAGLNSLIDGLVEQRAALPAADQAKLVQAAERAKAAVAEHQQWIDKQLIPNAKGNERVGAALFDEKLRLALNSPLSRQEIRQRAEATIADLRSKMYAVASGMLKGRAGAPAAPANPTPEQEQAVIEAGLAIVQNDLPARDGVI